MQQTTLLLAAIVIALALWIVIVNQKRDPGRQVAKVRKNGTIAWIERETDDDKLKHTFMRMQGEALVYRLPVRQDTPEIPFKVGDRVTITYDDHFPNQLLSIKAHPGDPGL